MNSVAFYKQEKGDYMKYCFVINPIAGKGAFVDELKEDIVSAAAKAGAEYDIFISESIGDTRGYVKETVEQYDGELAFFACGGDGTLCETILAVMSLDTQLRERVRVGIVPKGTGNDFVSNFESKELFCDIAAQIDGVDYDIDILKCNDLYSVNMINIGFDCHVVCKKEQIGKKKLVPRKLAYIFALILTFVKKPIVILERSKNGTEKEKKKLLLTTLANGAFCGGGFRSNPFASLTDGCIDCMEVKNITRRKFATMVGDYRKGLHLNGKYKDIINHFKARTTDIYFEEETPVSVDGEIIKTREIHVSVISRALKILLPRGVKPLVLAEDAK